MNIEINVLSEIQNLFGCEKLSICNIDDDKNSELRFGYWKQVEPKLVQLLLNRNYGKKYILEEMSWEDDDCGWQYSYKLKTK